MKNNPIIVIAGPTASGKTAMAVELAKKFGGEIINADSRSIYVGMDLGTGKPTKEEMGGIPHHLFDIVKPNEKFSFVEYKKLANEKIKEIQSRGKIPFIVGGTGLYIDSVVYDFEPAGEADWELRKALEEKDTELLYGMLLTFDPETAKKIDPKNKRRIIRALEIYEQTKDSKVKQEKKKEKPENILYLAIDIPREELYEKINKRIYVWMSDGLEAEIKGLLNTYSLDDPGMNGIGYKQIGLYLNGEISRDQAIEKFKQGDRNLAKRQITWLKRNSDILWVKSFAEAEKPISELIK